MKLFTCTLVTLSGLGRFGRMNTRTLVIAVALSFTAATSGFSEDPQVGTWKLNEEKSKIPPKMVRNTKVVFEPEGDKMKTIIDGVDKDGKPTSQRVWVGKRDGKFYEVKTSKTYDSVAYTVKDKNTSTFEAMKNGKVVMTGTITVVNHGKSREVTTVGTNKRTGKTVTSTAYYDKQ